MEEEKIQEEGTIQIETARLLLRDVGSHDLFALHELDSDLEVVRYVSYGLWTLEESQRDLAFHIDAQKTSPRISYYLAISLREEGRTIG